MNNVYANSKYSNFVIPIIVFLIILIPSYFGNGQKIELKILYLPFTMFLILSAFIFRQMCVFSLSMDSLIIKYPFKYPNKIYLEFKLDDIDYISFIDPKDGRMTPAKLEVHYKKDNTIRNKSISYDVKYSKAQCLIDELRKKGIVVKVNSVSLKFCKQILGRDKCWFMGI